MITAAKSIGLRGITLTDHIDYGFPEEPNIFTLDFDEYTAAQRELSERYTTDSFEVLRGLEMGLTPDAVSYNDNILKAYDFDFCIGSIHVVDNADPYYDNFWEGRHRETLCRHYYETFLENIRLFPYIDAIGHLDYIFRYGNKLPNEDTYGPYAQIVDAILEEIIKRDIALEVNTGGFLKGMKASNPGATILMRYKELGGDLITLGADAHHPENIANHFEETEEMIKSCGFKEIFMYKNGVPHAIKL